MTGICQNSKCFYGKSCSDLFSSNVLINGSYTFLSSSAKPITVYCDMLTDGGGWMLVTSAFIDNQVINSSTIVNKKDSNGGLFHRRTSAS